MKTIGRRLWTDERGSSGAMQMIFVTALVALGGIIGLVAIRDQVTQEFGDLAVALDNLDQSFSYTVTVDAVVVATASYSDPAPTLTDPVGDAPACLTFTGGAAAEGNPPPATTGQFP